MLNFQDLPDEVVLKILSFSETKDLITCGQVSKRIRKISRDGTLWVTANLEKKIVKTELLGMILQKGCRILNLCQSTIHGSLSLNKQSELRVLNLSQPHCTINADCEYCECRENTEILEEILFSCCFLQHLVIEDVFLSPKMASSICHNGNTLQILNLKGSYLDEPNLQEIIRCCQNLKEVDLAYEYKKYGNEYFDFLAKNMPPNVKKLNLGNNLITDDEVQILLSRCKKIKAVNPQGTRIIANNFSNPIFIPNN